MFFHTLTSYEYYIGLSLLLELLEFDQRRRKRASDALKHPYFVPVPLDFSKVSENVSDSKGRE